MMRPTVIIILWAATWQNQQNECVPSEDSDQPGHPTSLIRVFAVRMKKPLALSYPLSTQRRLWSDWVDAQAGLSLHWAHIHVGFVMSWLLLLFYEPHYEKTCLCHMRRTKTQIILQICCAFIVRCLDLYLIYPKFQSLCIWAGSFEVYLAANLRRQVFSWQCSYHYLRQAWEQWYWTLKDFTVFVRSLLTLMCVDSFYQMCSYIYYLYTYVCCDQSSGCDILTYYQCVLDTVNKKRVIVLLIKKTVWGCRVCS